jgi:hypothetical protein
MAHPPPPPRRGWGTQRIYVDKNLPQPLLAKEGSYLFRCQRTDLPPILITHPVFRFKKEKAEHAFFCRKSNDTQGNSKTLPSKGLASRGSEIRPFFSNK